MSRYHGSFESLSFPKPGEHIITKAKKMIGEIEAKIKEREGRVKDLATEMKLDSSMDVLMNLDQLAPNNYSNSGSEIQLGKASALRSEITAIHTARTEQQRLQMIVSNLPAGDTFKLTFGELEYFGF